MTKPRIGVLALQGAFAAHANVVRRMGYDVTEVRVPVDLETTDALIIPGGESTTISHLLHTSGLFTSLCSRLRDGMPAFGTCAGMILLAKSIEDGTPDQGSFGAIDIDVRRNAYGRQVDSFETDVEIEGFDEPFHAMFIRAPQIVRMGDGVRPLAVVDGDVVLASQGAILVSAFHPELTDDDRIHRIFVQSILEV
jgi:5'-phosphate synthase pdxT subunit